VHIFFNKVIFHVLKTSPCYIFCTCVKMSVSPSEKMQQVSYGPLIMSIMLIMSCYTGFFNVRRGWQSLSTGPRFYLRLIRKTDWLLIYTSRTTDGCLFKPKKLSVPFLYPGVPARLAPFRRLVPLGRRNLVPILPPAHPLGGSKKSLKIPKGQSYRLYLNKMDV
jgi:hypothetical protein